MNRHHTKDEDLIEMYLAGDPACMDILINRHKTKVFTAIQLVVNDRYISEDIFQDTFLRVIHTLQKGKYEESGKFLPWVMRIARNIAMDYFRITKRMPTISLSESDDIFSNMKFLEKNSEDLEIKNETQKGLRDLIKQLSPDQKEVLIMRHYGDMSFKEIADIMGCSVNTCLGRMRYALLNLKKLIEQKASYLQN